MRLPLPALLLLLAPLAACVTSTPEEPVRVLRSSASEVVLRGLVDATRTAPPERFNTVAQAECARSGKSAVFASMVQRSTYGFDITYRCTAKS